MAATGHLHEARVNSVVLEAYSHMAVAITHFESSVTCLDELDPL